MTDEQMPEVPQMLMDLLYSAPDDPSSFRIIAEWLYINGTVREDREYAREVAAIHRSRYEEAGIDATASDQAEMLWHAWYLNSACWQQFILGDCFDEAHIEEHATRALQWSGIVLLLTTEDVPNPDEGETS